MILPATPIPNTTKPFAATSTNSVVTLSKQSPQIIINVSSSSTGEVFYRTGKTAAEAVAVVPTAEGDYPLMAGTIQTFTKPDDHLYIGFITNGTDKASGWVSPAMGN